MNGIDQLSHIYDYIRTFLDIGLLTFILYKSYGMIVKTQGIQIIRTLVILLLAYAAARFLKLTTIEWLLSKLAQGIIICFAIVFQPELRKIFLKLGQGSWRRLSVTSKRSSVDAVLTASEMLSKQKRGMLVVFERHTGLKDIKDTGTLINADLSSSLLITIFGHDTPLHDGAVVVQGAKIVAAGCFLPLSEQYDIKKTFGTRHRSALGLAENSDAVVVVVSEETGAISLAYDSHLYYDLPIERITQTLEMLLEISSDGNKEDSLNEVE